MRALCSIACALAALLVSGAAWAADLEESSIRNGESFEISPFSFYALYGRDVTFAGARLIDQDGKATDIPVGVAPRARLVSFDLPVLAPHGYRLEWRVRESGGGETRNQVSFVVRGCKDPRAAPASSPAPSS